MEKKNNSFKLLGWIIGGVFALWLIFNVLLPILFQALAFVGVIAIVGAVGYVAFRTMNRKSIGGGRRTLP
jgi:hypothetical protein